MGSDAKVIRRDEIYPLQEFKRRTGLGRQAYTNAERNGLQVAKVGNRKFVTGRAWLAYLDQLSRTEQG